MYLKNEKMVPSLPSKPQRENPCQPPSSVFQMEDSLQQYQQFDLHKR